MTAEQLLTALDAATNDDHGAERALYLLLRANQPEITGLVEEDPEYFHKAFRQIDVCRNGETDAAIWLLLDKSTAFWPVFEKLLPVNTPTDER